ncbi:MAG: cupredoxin domain-containing protein [Cyanobacteria bacterium P01_A01_bin.114]
MKSTNCRVNKLFSFVASLVVLLSLVGSLWASIPAASAATAPAKQSPRVVQVHLGNASGDLRFEPDELSFVAGQRYKLVLDNPSSQKHYFTAKDFADAIWSQKVEAGNVEIKGAIHELELRPGTEAEWFFVAEKPGTYELHCAIAGHTEAGMVGRLVIAS